MPKTDLEAQHFESDLDRLRNNDKWLKELSFRSQNLTLTDIDNLFEALTQNNIVIALSLTNNINDAQVQILVQKAKIRMLNLWRNNIGVEGAKVLAQSTVLRGLDLSKNHVGDEGARMLAQSMMLIMLYLSENNIGDEGAKAFAQSVTLRVLDLGANKITVAGAQALANSKMLVMLNLSNNNVGDEGAKALANSATITSLHLFGNNVGDVGAQALAQSIMLVSLYLGNNNIGDAGAYALAQSTTLTTLDLSQNKISDAAQAAVSAMLARNQGLADKLFNACEIGDISQVRNLLASGVKPYGEYFQRKLPYLSTLLHIAVNNKNAALLRLLLDNGAGVEQHVIDNDFQTPLDLAKSLNWSEGIAILTHSSLSSLVQSASSSSISSSKETILSLNTLESTVAQLKEQRINDANQLQDLQGKLVQTVEAQQLLVKQEVLSDYQKFVNELVLQTHSIKEAQENEFKAIWAEIEKTKEAFKKNPEQPDLLAKLKQLEEKQAPLIKTYEAQQAILAQQIHLFNQESLGRFYRVLQGKLHGLFAACNVIDSGLVVRADIGKVEKIAHHMTLAGEAIPLPGAQAMSRCLVYIMKKAMVAKGNVDTKLHQIATQTVSFAEIDVLTEEIARQLTLTYEEQLLQLDAEQATTLAESAMKLMLAYLWEGDFKEEALSEQLIHSVAHVKTPNEHSQGLAKLRQKFKELNNRFQDAKLITKFNEQWTAFRVFQCPGIEVKTGEAIHYYSGQGTQPDVYGYRLGTGLEVEIARLKQDSERLPSRLHTKKLSASSEKHLNAATIASKSAQDKTELLEKQVTHLANQLATLSATQSGASSSNPLFHQAPRITKPVNTVKEPVAGVMVDGLTLSLDLTSIPADKHDSVTALMEDYSENCKEKDIARNGKSKIIALTLPTSALVKKLEEKLTVLLDNKLVMKNTN